MALQAMWIRKNMLQSPATDQNSPERRLSENEMRVLRSIQKLSIPDWYLNNNSRPPKILSNNTPIDQRPSTWKDLPVKKSENSGPRVASVASSTVYHNGVPETQIGPTFGVNDSTGTYKIDRSSAGKKSPRLCGQEEDALPKNPKVGKIGGKSGVANVSQTFPRLSPSRKIRNINIVFSQPMRRSEPPMITDLDEPEKSVEDASDDPQEFPVDETCDSSMRRETEVPFGVTPRGKFPITESFKLRATSTPRGSPPSSAPSFDLKETRAKEDLHRSPPISSLVLPTGDSTIEKLGIGARKEARSSPSREGASPKGKRASPSPGRASIGFRPKNVLPSIPEKCPDASTPCVAVTTTAQISPWTPLDTAMEWPRLEMFLESGPPSFECNGLVGEIIQELNERCSIPSPSRATSISKTFVEKLVEALESGQIRYSREKYAAGTRQLLTNRREEVEVDEDRLYAEEEVAESVESETGSSEDDVKSAAISTSLSWRSSDSGSSDTDIESPTMTEPPRDACPWNDTSVEQNSIRTIADTLNNNREKMTNNNYANATRVVEAADDNDEDRVYWIEKKLPGLPRTSSLLSIISRGSSNGAIRTSPCYSPIDRASGSPTKPTSLGSNKFSTNAWGATYRNGSRRTSGLWRIGETTVLDSGYSDRSSIRSSVSSYVEDNSVAWYDVSESTRTASEIGSSCSESARRFVSSDSAKTIARIHGRPFLV